jgi:hypothetical protein
MLLLLLLPSSLGEWFASARDKDDVVAVESLAYEDDA